MLPWVVSSILVRLAVVHGSGCQREDLRDGKAALQSIVHSTDASISKAVAFHLVGPIDIPQVHDDRTVHYVSRRRGRSSARNARSAVAHPAKIRVFGRHAASADTAPAPLAGASILRPYRCRPSTVSWFATGRARGWVRSSRASSLLSLGGPISSSNDRPGAPRWIG